MGGTSNALAQAERIAKTRGIDQSVLEKSIRTESRNQCHWMAEISHACGIVNVLKLNLALDDLSKAGGQRDTR